MEREYEKNFYVEKASDIAARAQYDDNGFAKSRITARCISWWNSELQMLFESWT